MSSVAEKVDAMAAEANRGCGQSYDVFVQRFSGLFDGAYPVGHPDREQALACAGGIYATPEELQQAQDEMEAAGYCAHGLDPDCCPMGCGDL